MKKENLVLASQSSGHAHSGNQFVDIFESEELDNVDGDVVEGYDNDDVEYLESGQELENTEGQDNYFLMAYVDFLNRMCHVKYVPHITMQVIASEFHDHALKSQEIREVKLRESLKNKMTEEDIV